jgi:hypothetical protein
MSTWRCAGQEAREILGVAELMWAALSEDILPETCLYENADFNEIIYMPSRNSIFSAI